MFVAGVMAAVSFGYASMAVVTAVRPELVGKPVHMIPAVVAR